MKRFGVLFLQLLVTAAIVFWIWHDRTRRSQIADALRHADWHWLLLGWLCYAGVEILATARWQVLLRVQNVRVSWLHAGAIVIIGLFYNVFLPGLVGGDALRLYFVFKEAPRRKTRAALSIVMDRLLGLASLVILAGAVVAARFHWLRSSTGTLHITYLALALLSGALLFVVLLFGLVGFGLLNRLPRRLPIRRPLVEAGEALNLYRTRLGGLTFALLLTLVSHLAYYLTYFCAGRALQTDSARAAGVADMISIMPLVNTITAIPISFGGFGVRETLFQKLLGDLAHIPVGVAVLTASLGFALQAAWGLVGGAAYLVLRRSRPA